MLVPFETLPETARIWIYQCNRTLTDSEVEEIHKDLEDFLTQWTAHGADLRAGFELPYKRFIVLGLDQEGVPGGRYKQSDYVLFNAALGFTVDSWNAEFYIDNIADENAELYVDTQQFTPRVVTNRPRTFGLRVGYRFE